ncbi:MULTISPECIES: glycosyltransferase [unclassified Modicisalibacter]|uniref:glycosyltransferase n=1 Tax=unclassified Modicisalibacter TaxID=2679913 RepID=UPI001CC9D207|nr:MULTISPECIES: glycosyltransferase [unclassified Modicisalibacter]MBZ9556739.1 glycosyltransferase [Modicisalibacter sp. R2A 31.J]MBZ9574792.1 glycosyltransferase [Modicisalibacter sp. MOD 31.J]
MSKRFAFVIEDLYGGGAEKSLLYTADGLRQRGNTVEVFILRDRIEHRVPPGLTITNLQAVNRFTKLFSNAWVERWQARRIARALDAFAPDVIISCSCDKITRHLRYPNLHFWIKSDISAKFSDPALRAKAFAKVHRFYTGRKVIAVSQGVERNLREVIGLEPAEIRAIYNPYEREPFLAMAEEPANLPNGDYLINVGTYEPRKRHDRLLRAYKASGVTTPLVLLGKGKGDQEARLRALIDEMDLNDRVILPGYQTNPYPFIRHARALILTSDAEGLPRALIEALLLGTPVVSVDCPSGPREILGGTLAPFLVPMDDEPALADAIARMDADPIPITEDHYRPFLKDTVLPQFEALE